MLLAGARPARAWDDLDFDGRAAEAYRAPTAVAAVGYGLGIAGVGFAIAAAETQTVELLAPAVILAWALGPGFVCGGALEARKALKRMVPRYSLTAAPGIVGLVFWAEFPPGAYVLGGIQLGKNDELWQWLTHGSGGRFEDYGGEDDEEDWYQEDLLRDRVAPPAPVVVPVVSPVWSGLVVGGAF